MSRTRWVLGCLVACALSGHAAIAGQDAPVQAPAAPAVMSRDASGRNVIIRAVRVDTPIKVDGKLDEAIYQTSPPITDFLQVEPHEGQPVTQKTDVWVLFDDKNFYVVFRCYDDHPERMVVNEMRRDNPTITQNEYVNWGIDSFHDRRNGVMFVVNPLAGKME